MGRRKKVHLVGNLIKEEEEEEEEFNLLTRLIVERGHLAL